MKGSSSGSDWQPIFPLCVQKDLGILRSQGSAAGVVTAGVAIFCFSVRQPTFDFFGPSPPHHVRWPNWAVLDWMCCRSHGLCVTGEQVVATSVRRETIDA